MAIDLFARLPRELQHLRLRRFAAADVEPFHAYRSDAEVARFQGWSPMDKADAMAFVRRQMDVSPWLADTWRQLAIAHRDDDVLLGDMGVWLSPDEKKVEFGISLARDAQGRGHGGEAVRGLLDLLFTVIEVDVVQAHVDIRNAACIGLLESCGLRRVGMRREIYKGEPCVEYSYRLMRDDAVTWRY